MNGWFPETVEIDGRHAAINTRVSVGAAFERLMRREDVSPFDRAHTALRLYYPAVPANTAEALERIAWFYRGGRAPVRGKKAQEKTLDLDADRWLLYAAFLAQYGVDIEKEDMHWWRFRALLEGLTAEHAIVRIMSVRAADISDYEGAARERLAALKRAYSLGGGIIGQKSASELERRLMAAGRTEIFERV